MRTSPAIPKLIFPENVLEQHLVTLGKTGAGKSSALRHMVEHLLAKKKRVCVIDPKGDWNGLKVAADGKGAGFPIILFGDFKEVAGKSIPADVPLNEYSGKHIAELVTSGNRPCVIGLRGWTQGEMHRFWIDFASTFFNSNEGEIYLTVDEVHNFAPKGKVLSPEVGKCLHWTNRLLSEARGLGAVMLIASQRPQKVHNDTLTACETLVAMRVIHKADRNAVEDWIEGAGDPAMGKEVLKSLAGMKRGKAYVWSPEVKFGPKRLTFPMFTTYDSFAPPQLQKKVSGKDWGSVDLDEVREKLSAVIEKAKAEDPRELQKTVREQSTTIKTLEVQIKTLQTAKPAALVTSETKTLNEQLKQQQARVSALRKTLEEIKKMLVTINAKDFLDAAGAGIDEGALIKAVEAAVDQLKKQIDSKLTARNHEAEELRKEAGRIIARVNKLLDTDDVELSVTVRHQQPFAVETSTALRAQPARREISADAVDSDFKITSTQQRVLDALSWYESIGRAEPSNVQIGAVALIDHTGGYFGDVVRPLAAAGLVVQGRGRLALTDGGRAQSTAPLNISTLADYHAVLRDRARQARNATGKTLEALNAIIESGAVELSNAELGAAIKVDHTGGYFGDVIRPLVKVGLITRERGAIRPTDILFPLGL